MTAQERLRIENDLKQRFTTTFGQSRIIMRLTDSNVWAFGNPRATEYSKSLDALTIEFVDKVERDALGQAQGSNTIQISTTKYNEMVGQNRQAAVIELEATIAHEMAHNAQLSGREPMVTVRDKSKKDDPVYSVSDTATRAQAFIGGLSSAPAKVNIEQEPFAYYLEAKLFEDSYGLRKKLKSFENANNWSQVYKAYYADPQFFWSEAAWKTWTGGVESLSSPPKDKLDGTRF